MKLIKRIFDEHTTIVVFFLMLILAGIASDKFYDSVNIGNVMRQSVPLGAIALGSLFVILIGGIDLSVGSVAALGNVTLVLVEARYGITMGILAAVAVCAVAGLVSGLLVTKGNIVPFVATLAMLTIVRGVVLMVTNGQPYFVENENFINFSSEEWLGLPKPFILLLGFFLVCWILLCYTIFGRILIAIGSNEMAARYAALRVSAFKTMAYAYCGLACGLASVILSSRTGVGSPLAAEGLELDAISAVVVGGASLSGGRGTATNTLLGVFIISMISNIMNLLNLPGYHQKVVKGMIILFAVLAESLKNRRGA